MRDKVRYEIGRLSSEAKEILSIRDEWSVNDGYTINHPNLDAELYVGGVYIRLFLKSPKHNLRSPQLFLEAALAR